MGAGADATPSGAFQARLAVYPLNANVAETLTRVTADYRVEPLLATRWEHRGGNTWRFHLRQGVRFHDGQPLTAGAVEWSVDRLVKGGFGSGFLDERSVSAVDDSTVDITATRPNLRLPEQIVHPNYSIFAVGTDPGVTPVGTGPFRFVEYVPNVRLVAERNEGYWGEAARLRRMTFRFYPDATTRVLALLAGEVDLIMDMPREQVPTLERRRGLRVVRAPVGQTLGLHVNAHGRPPYDLLSDAGLRRAVALSIDRGHLVQQVLDGEAEAVQNMTVPRILGSHAGRVEGYAYDPREAARLLDRLGWKTASAGGVRRRGDRRLRLVLLSQPELGGGVPEFVQAQLREAGFDVEWVRLPDVGSFAERQSNGEFDLSLSVPNQNDANPLFLPALIFYSRSERPFARWHHASARYDGVVEEGLRTKDPEEARRLAAEAIRIAVQEAVVIPLAALFRIYAMKTGVEGLEPHPSQTNQDWTAVRIGERSGAGTESAAGIDSGSAAGIDSVPG